MMTHTNDYWVSEFNFLPEVTKDLHIPSKVRFYDVTLREIDQTPGAILRKDEKISMAKEFDELGVDYIEIFPIVSKEDAEALTEITRMPKKRNLKTSALVRCVKEDVDAAAACGVKHVMLEGPAHLYWAQKIYGWKDENEMVKKFVDTLKYAQSLGMEVASEPWDCGRSTLPILEKLYKELANAGLRELIYADTFNNSCPWTIYFMIRKMREWLGDEVELGVHFHNDFGLATANALAGVAAGATIIHTALNFAGERGGNIGLEEVAVALKLLMNVETDVDLSKLYPAAQKLSQISKLPINAEKPILGRRTFMSGSGLNIDAWDKLSEFDRLILLPFSPKLVGQQEIDICWGKGCGTNMVINQAEKIGVKLTKEQGNSLRDKIKEEAMIRKSLLPVDYVNMLIREASKAGA
jgi:isopropylmalate/homocitrate/citramalate synthase